MNLELLFFSCFFLRVLLLACACVCARARACINAVHQFDGEGGWWWWWWRVGGQRRAVGEEMLGFKRGKARVGRSGAFAAAQEELLIHPVNFPRTCLCRGAKAMSPCKDNGAAINNECSSEASGEERFIYLSIVL